MQIGYLDFICALLELFMENTVFIIKSDKKENFYYW